MLSQGSCQALAAFQLNPKCHANSECYHPGLDLRVNPEGGVTGKQTPRRPFSRGLLLRRERRTEKLGIQKFAGICGGIQKHFVRRRRHQREGCGHPGAGLRAPFPPWRRVVQTGQIFQEAFGLVDYPFPGQNSQQFICPQTYLRGMGGGDKILWVCPAPCMQRPKVSRK